MKTHISSGDMAELMLMHKVKFSKTAQQNLFLVLFTMFWVIHDPNSENRAVLNTHVHILESVVFFKYRKITSLCV